MLYNFCASAGRVDKTTNTKHRQREYDTTIHEENDLEMPRAGHRQNRQRTAMAAPSHHSFPAVLLYPNSAKTKISGQHSPPSVAEALLSAPGSAEGAGATSGVGTETPPAQAYRLARGGREVRRRKTMLEPYSSNKKGCGTFCTKPRDTRGDDAPQEQTDASCNICAEMLSS